MEEGRAGSLTARLSTTGPENTAPDLWRFDFKALFVHHTVRVTCLLDTSATPRFGGAFGVSG